MLNGETETGVTTMRMDAGLDTGDMLLSSRLAIPPDMTAGELYDALADEGAVLLSRTLREMEAGTLRAVPQPAEGGDLCSHARSKPFPDGLEEAGLRAAQSGARPESLAVRHYGGGGASHEVHRSRVGDGAAAEPGRVVKLNPLRYPAGRTPPLELLEIQAEGSKRMPAPDYFRGHPVKLGIPWTPVPDD